MGRLVYGSPGTDFEIDDRALAHLKVAMTAKLRRNENFTLSIERGLHEGSGRTTIWIHPTIPLQFVFSGSRQPPLNREWVEQLMASANSSNGLHLTVEPR